MKGWIIAIAFWAVVLTVGATQAGATTQPPADPDCVIVIDSAEVWANFAPNDTRATFIGPPAWPADVQGTWIVHDKIPGGHVGPDGVYSRGNPAKGGNWFYRQAEVSHEECVEEPPVTCEEDPQQPGCDIPGDPNCETDPELCPVFPPDDPEKPTKPEKPAGGTTGGPERACDTANHETGDQNAACASLPHTGLELNILLGVALALLTAGGTLWYLGRKKDLTS